MDKRLAKELIKSRRAVKEKYQILKSEAATSQTQLEKTYQPITQPLQQLISTIAKTEPIDLEIKEEEPSRQFYTASTPTKTVKKRTGKTPLLQTELPSFFETSITPQFTPMQDISVIAESTPPSDDNTVENLNLSEILEQTRQSIQHYVDTPGYQDWLSDFHDLPREYIDGGVRDTEHNFDHNYGIVHDIETNKFLLGTTMKSVEIIDKNVKVEGKIYNGTPGLYELLFKKQPVGYKKQDLDDYMDILAKTNAYRRNHDADEQVQGNGSYKYVTIIGPYLQTTGVTKSKNIRTPARNLVEAFSRIQAPYRATRQREVKGGILLKTNKTDTDYVYWDNINELVDRLQLLMASAAAGHTGHNNEIVSIIEELREAKVIV